MNDRERLLALLESFGLEPGPLESIDSPDAVILRAHHGGVVGYGGFVCVFNFHEDGSFEEVGVWE